MVPVQQPVGTHWSTVLGRAGTASVQSRQNFLGQYFIGRGASAVWIVGDDGLAVAGGLGQTGGAGDNRVEDQLLEVRPDLGHNLLREAGAAVEHCHHHAQQGQARVGTGSNLVQQPREHRDALEGIVLALERHEQVISGGKGIEGEDAQ